MRPRGQLTFLAFGLYSHATGARSGALYSIPKSRYKTVCTVSVSRRIAYESMHSSPRQQGMAGPVPGGLESSMRRLRAGRA